MEIIKPGNLDRINRAIIFECPYCDCIFKVVKDEYLIKSQYNEEYFEVICPFCGSTLKIIKGN